MNKDEIAGLIAEFREHTSYEHEVSYGNIFERGADALTTLSARVETLEAQVQAAAKAERDRLRDLPDDVLRKMGVAFYMEHPSVGSSINDCMSRAVAALADALESRHD